MIEIFGIPYLKKGKKIYIKKKNRGKFREYCGGEVTDKCILKAKKSKNPILRKRAIFAESSRSWSKKHKDGGIIKFQNPAQSLKPSRNWDKTLTGKLINFSENPDSIGWDAKNRRWYAPPPGKDYDTDQFGMGVDRNQTPGFKEKVKRDSKGKEYLTVDDERYLRHMAIDRANKSANTRYLYAQKASNIKGAISPKHDAITVSAIYNLGPGHIARTIFENPKAMKAIFNRNSSEYQQYIHNLYKLKGRNLRIKNELKFFKLNGL